MLLKVCNFSRRGAVFDHFVHRVYSILSNYAYTSGRKFRQKTIHYLARVSCKIVIFDITLIKLIVLLKFILSRLKS